VRREVLSELPEEETGRPPLLFVPGLRHAAWCYAEHWLARAAARGYPAYAVSLRGHGASGRARRRHTTLRAYTHDVQQVAASLPRQAVLIGHGLGGAVVARALTRYPARAGVLVAPVLSGWRVFGRALLRNPFGTLPGLIGGGVRLSAGQLFSRRLDPELARRYRSRLDRSAAIPQYQAVLQRWQGLPIAGAPVLVVGSPDDKIVSLRALRAAAELYGTEPLLFPGMGHDMMLDEGWAEPIDAILDWLDKTLPQPTQASEASSLHY